MRFLLGLRFLYCVFNKMSSNSSCGGRRRRYRRGGEEEAPKPVEEDVNLSEPAAPGSAQERLSQGGRRHSRRHRRHGRKTLRTVPKGVHVKAKTLKRLLKAKGLKTSGKKSTLRARAREAHLIRGGR